MNNKNLKPFKLFALKNFPFIEADFDAITNYELLCKIVEYLNNVINSQNETNENVQNLSNAFNQLYNYVNDYFDNLDVQDEINNKLDEMVEQGTLQEIIADYLDTKAVFGFDSVNDMKEATNLIDGSYAETLGYYDINDGGSALYKIREITNEDVPDDMFIIALSDATLVAELIVNDVLNIKQCGAKSTAAFDNSTIINAALAKYRNIYIPDGNYKVSSQITLGLEYQNLNCDNKAMISSYDFTGDKIIYINNNYIQIKNLIIVNDDINDNVTSIYNNGFNTTLDTVTVTGTGKNCVDNNKPELRIYNSKFRGHYTGIYNEAVDLFMENVYIEQNTHNGFTSTKGSIEAHHVHAYANGGKGFYLVGSDFSNFYGCYADTNAGNGLELNNTKDSNFYGFWDFKSNQSVGGHSISVAGGYRNNFIGCKSTSHGTSSSGSFKFTATSYNNLLIGCEATKNPVFDNQQRVINCYGNLLKYNTDCNNYYINNATIANSASATFSATCILDTIGTPGVRVFKLLAPIRRSDSNNFSYLCSAYLIVSDSPNLNNIIYENDTNDYITISDVTLTQVDADNKVYTLSFNVTNNYANSIQLGGQVEYIGTTRSNL